MAEINNKQTTDVKNYPLPNVVRITRLSPDEREEYTSILGKAGLDLGHKLQDSLGAYDPDASVFYGFSQQDNFSLKMSPKWEGANVTNFDLGGLFGTASRKSPILAGLGATGLAISKGASAVGRFLSAGSSSTGVSTMKKYKGFGLTGFPVTVGWYLPQSIKQCKLGIKILSEMANPRPLRTDILSNSRNELNGDESRTQYDLITDAIERMFGTVDENILPLFGRTVTFDPQPVRVEIGNRVRLEPVVITGYEIKFSKEVFYNGKELLPQFVFVNLNFDFWLVPNPMDNKTTMLGVPMFNEKMISELSGYIEGNKRE